MKRILVPTDFSNNAYSALFYATCLFGEEACQFYILHTYEVNTPVLTSRIDTDKGNRLYKKLKGSSEEKLAETLHAIVRDTEELKHSFETISISKNLLDSIRKTIRKKEIDVVVMGTKGATGAAAFFMGSNTVQVIQEIHECPILLIPDQYVYRKPSEIGFSTDLKRFYLEKEIKPLVDFATNLDTAIRIFHINEKEKLDEIQEYNYTILSRYLKGLKHTIHWISKMDSKTKLIQDFIGHYDIDLLVMINYKHSFIEMITHEPIIKKIGFQAAIPFLVIPDAS
ncbi:hypothetical protein GCM10022393_10880 [Aquimarina addita]|uniref:UspA domain-containing protein n=1 Tax=Aquimarina addita TaxID=870485 RepID=A0ABP7XDP3_9FLAO